MGETADHRQWRHNWIRIAGVESVSTRCGINTGTAPRAAYCRAKLSPPLALAGRKNTAEWCEGGTPKWGGEKGGGSGVYQVASGGASIKSERPGPGCFEPSCRLWDQPRNGYSYPLAKRLGQG